MYIGRHHHRIYLLMHAGAFLCLSPLPETSVIAAGKTQRRGGGAHRHRDRRAEAQRWLHGATARVRHAFSPRDTPSPAHTRPRSCTWPLRRTPTLPRGMHAVRTRVPSARLVACACSALRLSATSAPDQRPATAKPHHTLHGTRTALQPAARCPRRGSKSQGAGAAGLDASPHPRCAVTSTPAHPTRAQAERGADARPRPQGMERGRRGRFPR